ncbi:hypothetical protein CDQ83_19795 [Clostridium thermosuccinogenes]|nr:hypothetical protein CDQ83_19795 [Pseudoclostridium thermosuccinogenes]
MRANIGWQAMNEPTQVISIILRGAPITGTLIASADDSADVERVAVTSFSHVDSGFTFCPLICICRNISKGIYVCNCNNCAMLCKSEA